MPEEGIHLDLYVHVRPLLYLLAVIVAVSAAILLARDVGASHAVYTVAQLESGLARNRAAWAGRVLAVRGRILSVRTTAANPGRHTVTLRSQTLPLYLLRCPPGATRVSTACTLVPGQGRVDRLAAVTQGGSRAALYLGLRSANPAQDRSVLWVQSQPPIGDPLLQLLHLQSPPAPLVWGRIATYRIVVSSSRPRTCPFHMCVDGYTLGT